MNIKNRLHWLLIFLGCLSYTSIAQPLDSYIDEQYPALDSLYKSLHQNPELSLQEKETSQRMASELKELGYEVTDKIGGYGVVGVLQNGPGPTLLIRTDMDALPMEEKTGLPYASTKQGVTSDGKETFITHSCGHDIHMSVFVGTAKTLMKFKGKWSGTLVLVAQPSEENGLGANNMMKDGLYSRFPHPDMAISLHDYPFLAAGTVGLKSGAFMAGVDMMNVTVHGKGGHGAAPHTAIDPIVLSAQMILAYQTIISRIKVPTDPAVITVGSIRGGTVHNIIPDEVTMQLTMRSYSTEVREMIIEQIKLISDNLARAAGLPEDKLPTYWIREPYTPALINDDALIARARKVFEEHLGAENVLTTEALMIGEDFSQYGLQERPIPITMFFLGAGDAAQLEKARKENLEIPGLHSPYFAPIPEPTIKTGVKAMSLLAMDILKK